MKKLRLKNGKIVEVDNGLAHGIIERGEGVLVGKEDSQAKEIAKAPKDKMMKGGRSNLRNK